MRIISRSKRVGRDVFVIAGGVTKFRRVRPDATLGRLAQEAFQEMLRDLPPGFDSRKIDSLVTSNFSDFLTGQQLSAALLTEALGLIPNPAFRVEGGGASGALAFQAASDRVASGRSELCLAVGVEKMSALSVLQVNQVIGLASDLPFNFLAGGYYSAYYALMARRRLEMGEISLDDMAEVAVKNRANALGNPFAQGGMRLSRKKVREGKSVADPFTRFDISLVSDGAACVLVGSRSAARALTKNPVLVSGCGTASASFRLEDRLKRSLSPFRGTGSFSPFSSKADALAAYRAYREAGIRNPRREIDFAEVYDAYSFSELEAYEDLGFAEFGKSGEFLRRGIPYPDGELPINSSGGLLGCGHVIGATGLMQMVFALWQLQGGLTRHGFDSALQLKKVRRGLAHSHGGTGTIASVVVLERA